MDRLRSFRNSFNLRRRRETNSPHQWQADENAVRSGNCAFQVKYLGCTEVFESRGMQTCEEALKTLRNSGRRTIRAVLHVSGDGLRVVDDETKDLIVDQTIEKVSFCAPDRNSEKGFSYICRDGTTRRWMCHGFSATKESGDRLSHAVGCAFAACLERKQRRDKECGVTMTFDQQTSTFTRTGSFRQSSLTERMQDPRERAIDVVPIARQVHNPHAIERPHATPSMLERQGSFRGFDQLNHASPFKRQLSLRNDLPSSYERARSHSLEPTNLSRLPSILSHQIPVKPPEYEGYDEVSPIPEISPSGQDSVSALCQQVTRDLSLLSSDDFSSSVIKTTTTVVNKLDSTTTTTTTTIIPGVTSSSSLDNLKLQNGFTELTVSTNNSSSHNNKLEENNPLNSDGQSWQDSSSSTISSVNPRLTPILNQCCPSLSPVMPRSSVNSTPALGGTIPSIFDSPAASPVFSTTSNSSLSSAGNVAANQFMNRSPVPPPPPPPASTLSSLGDSPSSVSIPSASSAQLTPAPTPTPSAGSGLADAGVTTAGPSIPIAEVQPVPNVSDQPKPEQWLANAPTPAKPSAVPPPVAPRRAPPLHARAMSLGSAMMNHNPARPGPADPFDAAWADTVAHRQNSTTNPFIMPNTTQAFQVQL